MRALVISRHGPPEVLRVEDRPDPTPGPGEVRVAVHAAGLNFADVSARQGTYPDAPPPPFVAGYEAAGVIDALGDGVDGLSVGDRVIAMTRFGGQADTIVAPQDQVLPMPAGMTFAEGAALPVNYLTAHHILKVVAPARPHSTILIHSAAGGVGTAALQLLADVPGVRVFGAAGPGKADYLRALGAEPLDSHRDDVEEQLRARNGGRGADLILDPIGGAWWKRNLALLNPAGTLVAYGFAGGMAGSRRSLLRIASQLAQLPWFHPVGAMNLNHGLVGVNMGHLWGENDLLRPQLEAILAGVVAGRLKPHIHAEVPLEEGAAAHAMLEGRQTRGKVVLTMGRG